MFLLLATIILTITSMMANNIIDPINHQYQVGQSRQSPVKYYGHPHEHSIVIPLPYVQYWEEPIFFAINFDQIIELKPDN